MQIQVCLFVFFCCFKYCEMYLKQAAQLCAAFMQTRHFGVASGQTVTFPLLANNFSDHKTFALR